MAMYMHTLQFSTEEMLGTVTFTPISQNACKLYLELLCAYLRGTAEGNYENYGKETTALMAETTMNINMV